MDRNTSLWRARRRRSVALRKESVDRNSTPQAVGSYAPMSLSARRAWIEILYPRFHRRTGPSLSARRAWIEILVQSSPGSLCKSLSARRAWIEIMISVDKIPNQSVALRKESVDRNATTLLVYLALIRSLSARRAWIEIIDDFEPSTTRRSLSARRAWIEIALAPKQNPTEQSRSPQGERG